MERPAFLPATPRRHRSIVGAIALALALAVLPLPETVDLPLLSVPSAAACGHLDDFGRPGIGTDSLRGALSAADCPSHLHPTTADGRQHSDRPVCVLGMRSFTNHRNWELPGGPPLRQQMTILRQRDALFDAMVMNVWLGAWDAVNGTRLPPAPYRLNRSAFAWLSRDRHDVINPDLVAAALMIRPDNGGTFWPARDRDRGAWLVSRGFVDPGLASGRVLGRVVATQVPLPPIFSRFGEGGAARQTYTLEPSSATVVQYPDRNSTGELVNGRRYFELSERENGLPTWRIKDKMTVPGAASDGDWWMERILPNNAYLTSAGTIAPAGVRQAARESYIISDSYGRMPVRVYAMRPGEAVEQVVTAVTQATYGPGTLWRVEILMPNRRPAFNTLDDVRAAFHRAADRELASVWPDTSYVQPVAAGPREACPSGEFTIYGSTFSPRTSECDPRQFGIPSRYQSWESTHTLAGCVFMWAAWMIPPPRLPASAMGQVFRRMTPVGISDPGRPLIIGQSMPLTLNTSLLGPRADNFELTVDIGRRLAVRFHLANVGISLKYASPTPGGGLQEVYYARAANGSFPAINLSFPRTPSSVYQDPQCRSARSAAELLDRCGIVFVRDTRSGRMVPRFRVIIRTWYSGVYEFVGFTGVRGLFHPRYAVLPANMPGGYWAGWCGSDCSTFSRQLLPTLGVDPHRDWGWSRTSDILGCRPPVGDNPADTRVACGDPSWFNRGWLDVPSGGSPMWDPGNNGTFPGTWFDVDVIQVQPGPG